MILKIAIDTKVNPEMFEDLGIPDQVVFAEVAAISALKDSRQYALKTLFFVSSRTDRPLSAVVTVRRDHSLLYLVYGNESIDIPVQVEAMQDFPISNWI